MVTVSKDAKGWMLLKLLDPLYLTPFSVKSLIVNPVVESALASCHVGDLSVNTSAGTKIEASLWHLGSRLSTALGLGHRRGCDRGSKHKDNSWWCWWGVLKDKIFILWCCFGQRYVRRSCTLPRRALCLDVHSATTCTLPRCALCLDVHS
ncbi:hypothetical protein Pmani_039474 [Petrolisthes manimaculis]|uniref:Uncharacterized protein n=1 Tax=Petrolisthes manimaculis TaxID=1843537 RepID=A0AAE1NE32_9EUCA|nr:hypothetical protein Pmani_039474 [Petrolisthes manimaculis]